MRPASKNRADRHSVWPQLPKIIAAILIALGLSMVERQLIAADNSPTIKRNGSKDKTDTEISELVNLLGHTDFKVRKGATDRLISIGRQKDGKGKFPYKKRVHEAVRISLKSSDPEVAQRAQQVLAGLVLVLKPAQAVEARHILFAAKKEDNDKVWKQQLALAVEIRKKLIAGTSFAKMAKLHSGCPSKNKGGDLGEFRKGMMVKSFEDAALTRPVNIIGPIVKTKFGYHILQVTKRFE
jgi:peptidyl-prolyl cis-trans isomerase C